MTICLASAMMQLQATTYDAMRTDDNTTNPLLQQSSLPFGVPDFSKIKYADYLPAFEAAIKQKRDNIKSIVKNKKKATFENTILAYEQSGVLLDRVTSIFYALVSADKTDEIAAIEKKVTLHLIIYGKKLVK